ncbi:MAG: helix-turn-helix domain-containing protein [Acidimicrobiales bacterium]
MRDERPDSRPDGDSHEERTPTEGTVGAIRHRLLRAERHAALGDPLRLAIVDDLAATDRSPTEIAGRLDVPSNLLAHHLDVLAAAGLIERFTSSGDRRRRYVRLVRPALCDLGVALPLPAGRVLFVCTHNSARSQLAAAIWRTVTGGESGSAGTHPAPRVHPGASEAARRAGLDLGSAKPRAFDPDEPAELTVTVCDRAHEELAPGDDWWHWSVPDPVEVGTPAAFDDAIDDIGARVHALVR